MGDEAGWRDVMDIDRVREHLHNSQVERGDEHLYAHMQSTLPTRLLVDVLRPAVAVARMHGHKFISERDFATARKLCSFPSRGTRPSSSFLRTKPFQQMVDEHLKLLCDFVDRYMDHDGELEVLRISHENLEQLRQQVDTTIALFVQCMIDRSTRRLLTTKTMDAVMAEWMHDAHYATREDPYVELSDI